MSVLVVLLPWMAAGIASVAALLQARARMRAVADARAARAALAAAEARLAATAAAAPPDDPAERDRQDAVLRRGEHLASLGRMLAGAAHELNNPLAAISGFAQLLLRSPMRVEERTALETIDHEARRAATVVRDLLTFSRRGAVAERRIVDLNAVARYIVGTRRYALETSNIQIDLDLADGTVEVLGDAAQLEQVVLNLVANAHEALDAAADGGRPPGARVTVRTTRLERVVVLEVADDGPGIARDDLAKIWEPFYTTKGARDGTGLGLSVVHRLVSDHGGVIDVDSEPGAGARFRVVLPLPTAQERDAARPAPSAELAREALDVLVAEPDPEAADFLARYLRTRGHAVIVAHDASHAARLAVRDGFDVVIASASLAAADDDALARRMRGRGDRTRCVLVTDAALDGATHAGAAAADGVRERAGASAVLARPFQIEQLRHAVEDA